MQLARLAGVVVCFVMLCCAQARGQSTAAIDEESSLVLHLSFDDSGDLATDLSPKKHAGQILGAKRVPGRVGQAMSFDGEDDAIDLGQSPDFDFDEKTSFTLSFWMKAPASAKSTFVLTKKLRGEPTEAGFTVSVAPSGALAVNLADGQHNLVLTGSTPVNDEQWRQVTIVAERGANAEIFIDGNLEASSPMAGLLDLTNRRRNLRVGDREYDNDYVGLLDEVKIHRGAIRPAPPQ